jgi:CDP-glucose 4,6-dehydratase
MEIVEFPVEVQQSTLDAMKMYRNVFAGKRVLITGHTGFKGAWLTIYMRYLGAHVTGYSLPAPGPCIFATAELQPLVSHREGDIRDSAGLRQVLEECRPHFVFHMAAQSLVLESYRNPVDTFETNVMGSVRLLEAIRQTRTRSTLIMVVSDKCYKNNEWVFGYREIDALGGHDPYSASKSAMDIAVRSYRLSYFPPKDFKDHGVSIAAVRSGNVVGGGDWGVDRIVPDAVRALSRGETLTVRSPEATRPWQHVLDPLSGYLWLAACLSERPQQYAGEWNFGPLPSEDRCVRELADAITAAWGKGATWVEGSDTTQHEAKTLKLNIDKAVTELQWRPVWNFETTVQRTISWYKQAEGADGKAVYDLCTQDIEAHRAEARAKGLAWAF